MDNIKILETLENLDLDNEFKSLESYLCFASNQLHDHYIAKCRIKSSLEDIRGISNALYKIKHHSKQLEFNLKDIQNFLEDL